MSYEGYTEALCEDGHYHVWDVYDDPPPLCDAVIGQNAVCGKPLVWSNEVDQTNGDGEEMMAKLEVAEEVKTETCSTCHHTQVVAQVRYKIPEDQGHKGKPIAHSDWYGSGDASRVDEQGNLK